MVFGAPVWVGLSWAAIIYSAYEVGRPLKLGVFTKSLFAALCAVSIDFGMDAVASSQLGFWKWLVSGEPTCFGVPFGNFFAWMVVVASFSFFTDKSNARGFAEYPIVVAGSLTVLALLDSFWVFVLPKNLYPASFAAVFLLSALLVFKNLVQSKALNRVPDFTLLLVPFTFHAFFLTVIVLNGWWFVFPYSLAALALSGIFYVMPFYGFTKNPAR